MQPSGVWFFNWVIPIVGSVFIVLAIADAIRRRRLTWGFLFLFNSMAVYWMETVGDWGQMLFYSPAFARHHLLDWLPLKTPNDPLFMPFAYAVYWGCTPSWCSGSVNGCRRGWGGACSNRCLCSPYRLTTRGTSSPRALPRPWVGGLTIPGWAINRMAQRWAHHPAVDHRLDVHLAQPDRILGGQTADTRAKPFGALLPPGPIHGAEGNR
ncbi:hypothetical protein I553_4845 [Mycobacterium xenopi 4042]|uniref:Uncharacterized protein n=1 Tax=Mycobacterium xenopi 4042 TaxID=1299334 RepID=X8AHT7_MYCXE|nr:hypothetical protein I553_4845 [Mycobacterium xenopi 4042]